MRKLINLFAILLSLIFALNTVNAQVQQAWVARFNGTQNALDDPMALTVDASGNVYVTGTADQGSYSNGTTIKYNSAGGAVWIRGISGLEFATYPQDIAVDGSGNIYITGNTYIQTDDCQWDCFVVKYNSSGTEQWARRYSGGSKFFSNGKKIKVDAGGNIYVTGVTGAEGPCAEQVGPVSEYFTLKYNTSGTLQWARQYNGTSPGSGVNNPYDMAVDAAGNVYVTGESQLNGYLDYATLKYNTNGDIQWTQRYNPTANGDDVARGIALDGSGNVYITGTTFAGDLATIKYNSVGSEQWVGTCHPSNGRGFATDIAVDGSGNIYVSGYSGGTSNNLDYLTVKYNTNGDQQWTRYYDGTGAEEDIALAIGVDEFGNAYVTGHSAGIGSVFDYATVKYNTDGVQQWVERYNGPANSWDRAVDLEVAFDNVYVTGRSNGTGTQEDYATVKYTQCYITCSGDITVNNDPGQCGAVVNYPEATTTGECGSTITYSKASDTQFPIGTTTVTVTSTATGATCSFNVTVTDNELPIITCPSNKTVNTDLGVCYASASSVNAGTATATDNCTYDVVGARSDGLALTANYPVGNTTITWTATDASNNTSTCLQTITVVDNVPPTITGESASTYVLSPPNHTMRDVTVNYTATDNCAATSVITVTSNEPINGVGDGDTDPDWMIVNNHHVKLRAERSAGGNGRIYTITVTATDPSGNTAVKTVEVRVPHDIKNPHSGQAFIVGSSVNFSGEFWDKPGNSHSAKWLIDDNTTAKATVTEPLGNKNGKVIGSYKFTSPGVYKLQMNITDQTGLTTYTNTAGDLEAIVVIFDPNGGNTYGGGYFNSPASALRSNPTATGKASYGFAMNYFKNSTYPKGETQFEFKVGSFEFNALNFEYLVVSNSMAQFKGTGKIIGGQSGVGFTMTVTDGQLDGTGVDKIRMKIYNKNNGSIIYDNQPGASDAALPIQAVGANSTVVISGTNSSLTSANTNQKGEMEVNVAEVSNGLDVIAFPNPSASNFALTIKTNSAKEKITMQVVDMYGRIIETRNVNANSMIRFGDRYNSGTYFVRIMQGKEHKELKLIKLSD